VLTAGWQSSGVDFAQAFGTGGIKFPPKAGNHRVAQHASGVAGRGTVSRDPSGFDVAVFKEFAMGENLAGEPGNPPWPMRFMTLNGRTLNPATNLFIRCTRDVKQPMFQEVRFVRSLHGSKMLRPPAPDNLHTPPTHSHHPPYRKSPAITTARTTAKSAYKRMARPIPLMAKPCQSG
jgi:hypothetical protein